MQRLRQSFCFFIAVLLSSKVLSKAMGKDVPSPATLQQLQLIENSINHDIEPCDDFYTFACGKWENQDFTTDNSSNKVVMTKNFVGRLEHMLIHEYPEIEEIKKTNQNFIEKTLTYYYSCQKTRKLNVLNELKPGLGLEWPALAELNGAEQSQWQNFDVFHFLGHLFSYGVNDFLFEHYVYRMSNGTLYAEFNTASQDNMRYVISYFMHSLGFDKINNYTVVQKYQDELDESHEQWVNKYKEFDEDDSELVTYGQVKEHYSQLAKLLDVMFPNQFRDTDLVNLKSKNYIVFLLNRKWDQEEFQKLCNYAMYAIVRDIVSYRQRSCLDDVRQKMHFAVNYMYRQNYYTAEIKADFNELKEKIYKYLLEMVNGNYLQLNDQQLQYIKDKLARIYISIGNVPDIANDAMLEDFYSHMPDMDMENFSHNFLMALKQRVFERIICPSHMECIEDLSDGPHNVLENDLVIISLASLDSFMYHHTIDPIFAVSLMGLFIGHEYGHSIDTVSLMEPKLYGELSEQYKNHENIKASIECSQQQFETSFLRQMEVDLVGARAAFHYYNTELKTQPSFTKIPWQQLFYLNYAQFFCKWDQGEFGGTEHYIRTNYVAMNMEEFSEAFKCPIGSKMNPSKKCLLY